MRTLLPIIFATAILVTSSEAKDVKQGASSTIEDASPVMPKPAAVKPLEAKDRIAKKDLREKKYFYSSFGMRDPFRTLVGGDFEAQLQELVDINSVQLVGILTERDERLAMLEDSQGFGYSLRAGDRVRSGTIVSVTKDALVARLIVFGQTTRVTLRLKREE